ncbi:integrase core domain-containing protein [Mycobacterium sp.]|uniref:integrase core domain-containing protein n=1 Tax=Mycobacterium sp. TaxID=1785 RepID=UPI0039C8FF86
MDNGPVFISQALQQFCNGRTGMAYIPPGTPWNNGHIESFNNRLRKECLNRNHWNTVLEAAWSSATSRASTTTDTATRPWATARPPSTLQPADAPTPQWPAASTESESNKPDSNSGWTWYRGLAS